MAFILKDKNIFLKAIIISPIWEMRFNRFFKNNIDEFQTKYEELVNAMNYIAFTDEVEYSTNNNDVILLLGVLITIIYFISK